MKKLIISFTVFLISLGISAQYKTFNFGGIEYKTDCFYNKNGFTTIKMQLRSLDHYNVELYIGTEPEYQSFMKRLNLLKTKMVEWDSVCVQNGIDKVDKLIEYNITQKEEPSVWFDRHYNSCKPLNAYAMEKGSSRIVFHTGEISSLTNKYIRCKGAVIIFYSPENIEEMLKAFNLSDIQEYIDAKNKKIDLLQ